MEWLHRLIPTFETFLYQPFASSLGYSEDEVRRGRTDRPDEAPAQQEMGKLKCCVHIDEQIRNSESSDILTAGGDKI